MNQKLVEIFTKHKCSFANFGSMSADVRHEEIVANIEHLAPRTGFIVDLGKPVSIAAFNNQLPCFQRLHQMAA